MNISVEDKPIEPDIEAVRAGLKAFNDPIAGDDEHLTLYLFARDEAGTIKAGLLGDTYWGWLSISILWVDEALRGTGIGTTLMDRAEEIALDRGCHSAHLDTMSFQALGFYQKRGYAEWGRLDDLPRGHSRIFLKKALVAPGK